MPHSFYGKLIVIIIAWILVGFGWWRYHNQTKTDSGKTDSKFKQTVFKTGNVLEGTHYIQFTAGYFIGALTFAIGGILILIKYQFLWRLAITLFSLSIISIIVGVIYWYTMKNRIQALLHGKSY